MSEVHLISWTCPIQGLEDAGIKRDNLTDLVAYCARVSNPDNQLNTETSERLISYMLTHHHWSPFEMVSLTLEIKTTRDIGRQILRHRSFSFQEFSQRYALQTNFTVREARLQDSKNRQHSVDIDSDEELKKWWHDEQLKLIAHEHWLYEEAIKRGLAKECVRVILSEGLTDTCMYMTGTLRSWIHYLQLRTRMDTQKEHREVANQCVDAIKPIFSIITDLMQQS